MDHQQTLYDYYGHKSKGFVGDYFGEIGDRVKVSKIKYYLLKIMGYRVTKIKRLKKEKSGPTQRSKN